MQIRPWKIYVLIISVGRLGARCRRHKTKTATTTSESQNWFHAHFFPVFGSSLYITHFVFCIVFFLLCARCHHIVAQVQNFSVIETESKHISHRVSVLAPLFIPFLTMLSISIFTVVVVVHCCAGRHFSALVSS